MLIRKLILIILLCSQNLISQNSLHENFSTKFVPDKDGGNIIFCRNNKQILVKFFGKSIENIENEANEKLPNRYFLAVDKIAIQAVLIPVPKNITDSYDMKKLTLEQQKQILLGYIDYEIQYMNSDQNTAVKDIFYAEGNVNSSKHYVWNYFYKNYDVEKDLNGDFVIGQFCVSTLVFDQVLTVSISILKDYTINPIEVLKKIVQNIEMNENKCE
jgi:hypothetical protein